MIAKNQPTIFPSELMTGVTDISDGNFGLNLEGALETNDEVHANRQRLASLSERSTLVYITYTDDEGRPVEDFRRYGDADDRRYNQPILIARDGLVTRQTSRLLILPIADCVGAIIYDPLQKICMLSHLGRHSTEQNGAYHCVRYLQQHFDVQPETLLIWLSPAAGKQNYPLYAFENKSLHEVIAEHFINAGVKKDNIEVSAVDTTLDEHYFSQSEYTKGNRDRNGRFVIYAMIKQ